MKTKTLFAACAVPALALATSVYAKPGTPSRPSAAPRPSVPAHSGVAPSEPAEPVSKLTRKRRSKRKYVSIDGAAFAGATRSFVNTPGPTLQFAQAVGKGHTLQASVHLPDQAKVDEFQCTFAVDHINSLKISTSATFGRIKLADGKLKVLGSAQTSHNVPEMRSIEAKFTPRKINNFANAYIINATILAHRKSGGTVETNDAGLVGCTVAYFE